MKNSIFYLSLIIASFLFSSNHINAQGNKSKTNKTATDIALLENKILALTSYVQKLVTENENLQKTIEKLKDGNNESPDINEAAKRLHATNINIDHYKILKDNNFKNVDKAKLIKKSVIWFEFIENKYAGFGAKTIDFILYDRAGNIINCQEKKFKRIADNIELCYSFESKLNYSRTNEMHKLEIIYDIEIKPNLYTLEIYTDGYLCGKREFAITK